jgi:anaerobic magnesium-protoporphyrin IX monomethyl ester cyclase
MTVCLNMDERKITLIVPPVEVSLPLATSSNLMTTVKKYPALGLGYIASVLEQHGYAVQFIDMFGSNITLQKLKFLLSPTPPRYVGITTDVATLNPARAIARVLKELYPNCVIIVGGYNIGVYPDEIIGNSQFDIGVVGEGEMTIIELMETIETGGNLDAVAGIVYKKNGRIVKTPPRDVIRDLDSLPYPARHLMPLKKYISSISKSRYMTTILASRGCPFNCIYCIRDHDYRSRSPKNVVDEIEHIVKNFKINELYFCDPTFSINQKRVISICKEIIRRKIHIVWEAATRVDCVSPELLKWMKRAGCARIQFGIESGDPRILRLMNKRITISQIISAFKWSKQNGLDILASFMLGCPGDTLETMARTIKFSIKLDPDYIVYTIATIGPGTDLHDLALKNGFIDKDLWPSYMRGELKEIPNPIYASNLFDRKTLEIMLKNAYRKFYLRPSYIFKRLLKTRSIFELKNNITGMRSVLIEILSRR